MVWKVFEWCRRNEKNYGNLEKELEEGDSSNWEKHFRFLAIFVVYVIENIFWKFQGFRNNVLYNIFMFLCDTKHFWIFCVIYFVLLFDLKIVFSFFFSQIRFFRINRNKQKLWTFKILFWIDKKYYSNWIKFYINYNRNLIKKVYNKINKNQKRIVIYTIETKRK